MAFPMMSDWRENKGVLFVLFMQVGGRGFGSRHKTSKGLLPSVAPWHWHWHTGTTVAEQMRGQLVGAHHGLRCIVQTFIANPMHSGDTHHPGHRDPNAAAINRVNFFSYSALCSSGACLVYIINWKHLKQKPLKYKIWIFPPLFGWLFSVYWRTSNTL